MASDEHDESETPRKSDRPRRSEEPRTKRNGDGRRRPAAPVEEPIPVFGGRLLLAGIFLLAMVVIPLSALGDLIEKKDPTVPKSNWKVGDEATIAVTVITADYNLLTCSSEKEIDGLHCAFKSEREPWPRLPNQPIDDNKASIIQPYRTWLDNKLLLIAGLWAVPEVAVRLHREPPLGVPKEKLARFVAECKVRFVGELPDARLRWDVGGAWQSPDAPALVAKPISCKVSNPDRTDD
jgi:hypothetical protein